MLIAPSVVWPTTPRVCVAGFAGAAASALSTGAAKAWARQRDAPHPCSNAEQSSAGRWQRGYRAGRRSRQETSPSSSPTEARRTSCRKEIHQQQLPEVRQQSMKLGALPAKRRCFKACLPSASARSTPNLIVTASLQIIGVPLAYFGSLGQVRTHHLPSNPTLAAVTRSIQAWPRSHVPGLVAHAL